MFASNFSSVNSFTSYVSDMQVLNSSFFYLPNNAWFFADDVLLKLSVFSVVYYVGSDGLPGDFLYKLRHVNTFSLWLIFWRYIIEDIFADILKISHITPIFNSGIISVVKNYRSISVPPDLSKTFEFLVLDKIML